MSKSVFDDTVERLKQSLNIKSDKDLAELLGISTTAFSERVRRKSIPYEEVIRVCAMRGFNLDYIFGLKPEFEALGDFAAKNVCITKYTKGYHTFGNEAYAEPFVFNNVYCSDEYAKFTAVTADSVLMFPVIDMGDTVIINENKKEVTEDGKIFLVNYKGTISAVRLFKTLDKDTHTIKVECPLQKDITAKAKDLIILGRVTSVHTDF